MAHGTPDTDIDENDLEVHDQKHAAAGVTAVAVSMKRALQQMGADAHRADPAQAEPGRRASTACRCAWPDPDPDHRHTAEFCENGAKAVAEEATTARVDPEFFAEHSLAELAEQHRVLARPAGPDHPPDGAARRGRRTTSRSAGTTRSR